jgi:hypothetical protein
VKRLLYASFLLAYLLTFLVFHSAISVIDYNARGAADTSVVFLPLGIPPAVHQLVFPLAAVAYLATLVASAVLLLRHARGRDLVPAAALVLTQALWFSIPFGVRYFGIETGVEPIDLLRNQIQDYFSWVAIGHAAQYLWVTSYYARGSGSWRGFPRYLGKVLASGVAIWMLPVLFFAPLVRGHYEYAGGLALLVSSVVNIHHFILDGAIWKLRGPIAQILIRSDSVATETALRSQGRPLRRLVWAGCFAALALSVGALALEQRIRASLERKDFEAVRAGAAQLAALGRESGSLQLALGNALHAERRIAEARESYRRGQQLLPNAKADLLLAATYEQEGDWRRAAELYEAALEKPLSSPQRTTALALAGKAWQQLGDDERALARLEEALARDPQNAQLAALIERARRPAPP